MDYSHLLSNSYAENQASEHPCDSRVQFLARDIFNFTTYDSGMDELLGTRAVEVCKAINTHTTFDYIKTQEQYRWYIVICNLPFFADRLDWGTSIRGAWWSYEQPPLESCGLYLGTEQLTLLNFSSDQWRNFIDAVAAFPLRA